MPPKKHVFLLILLFFLIRSFSLWLYKDTYYYYGMVLKQFVIADGLFHGHAMAYDKMLTGAALALANRENRSHRMPVWLISMLFFTRLFSNFSFISKQDTLPSKEHGRSARLLGLGGSCNFGTHRKTFFFVPGFGENSKTF